MPRGGYHPNAERWGRKSAWQSESPTKTVRLPENLIEQVLDYAHKLDSSELIDYDTKSKNLLNLEELRDRYLANLRLGKQAPEYKRVKKTLDSFIASIRSV